MKELKKSDPNSQVLAVTYVCVALFLALAVYMGYFLQVKSEDVINNPYNARLDSFSDRIVSAVSWQQTELYWQKLLQMMGEMRQEFITMEVCLTMQQAILLKGKQELKPWQTSIF